MGSPLIKSNNSVWTFWGWRGGGGLLNNLKIPRKFKSILTCPNHFDRAAWDFCKWWNWSPEQESSITLLIAIAGVGYVGGLTICLFTRAGPGNKRAGAAPFNYQVLRSLWLEWPRLGLSPAQLPMHFLKCKPKLGPCEQAVWKIFEVTLMIDDLICERHQNVMWLIIWTLSFYQMHRGLYT